MKKNMMKKCQVRVGDSYRNDSPRPLPAVADRGGGDGCWRRGESAPCRIPFLSSARLLLVLPSLLDKGRLILRRYDLALAVNADHSQSGHVKDNLR